MDSDDEGRFDGVEPESYDGEAVDTSGGGFGPDFLSDNDQSSWGNFMQSHNQGGAQEGAKSLGRFAENGAAKTGSAAGKNGAGNSKFMSAIQNAKDAEGRGGFANNVQGKTLEKAAAASMPGGKMIMNQAKKLGPFGTILIIVGALVGIFAGTQSLAPFGLVANGLDQFNNLRTSMNKRTTYFKRFKLDKSRNTPVTSKATIFSPEKFRVSNHMSNKLKKQNIYYFGEKEGYSTRFMVYEDKDTGKRYAVTANEGDIGGVPDSVKVKIDGEDVEININTKMKIDDALIESDNFSRSFDVGTRTLKGHIAGWFDDLSTKFHLRIGSSRNKFRNVSDTASDEEVNTAAHPKEFGGVDDGLSEDIKPDESNAEENKKVGVDDDGNDINKDVPIDENDSTGVRKKDTVGGDDSDIQGKVGDSLHAKAKNIVGAMGTGVNLACAALRVYSAINTIVAAIHVANILNYLTGYLEAIDKTKTGDAGKNELAYYMNSLSEKGATKDTFGNVIEGKEHTSSLESPAWNQFFSSGSVVVQPDDKVAEKFNRDYVARQSLSEVGGIGDGIGAAMEGLISSLGGAIAAYQYCLGAQMAVDMADMIVDIVLVFTTGGIGNFIKSALKEIFTALVLGGVISALATVLMSTVVPHIAKWMAMDLISNMAGEDAAYAINSGFNIYAGGQMQSSSGLPATKDTLMAHWRAQQEVIADEGALERSMRSPFDPTSKYTFLGSIVNSLMPIANTWSSPLMTISKTVNTVGTSFMNLRPTAMAEGEAKFETSLNYDCPTLSQIGIVGDAYCSPYIVTDMTTMAADPSDVIDEVSTDDDKMGIDGNFKWDDEKGWVDTDDDGEPDAYNPTINPSGDLAKWVVSCAARDSQFGIVDANTMGAVTLLTTDNEVLDNIIGVGVGSLPIIGDAFSIAQGIDETVNIPWATGENCIKEEYKYYSRYSEDQRMMESSGIIEKSTVAMFLDDYYKEHPIDNSYEGRIARLSGMTKDQLEETLAYVEAFEWLAEYNPKDYGPEKPEPKTEDYQYESNDIIAEAEKAVVGNYIVFDDLRTKTKVA